MMKNNIIKVKNFFFSLLYNYHKLVKTDFDEGTTDNTEKILNELNIFMKSSNFVMDGSIPSEWYVKSLLEYLKKLPENLTKNDCEELYKEMEDDINKSIKGLDFEALSVIMGKLKFANRIKLYYQKSKELLDDIKTNEEIKNIITRLLVPVDIKFEYDGVENGKFQIDISKMKDKDYNNEEKKSKYEKSNKIRFALTIENFPKNIWTIHGLWPNYKNGTIPGWCNGENDIDSEEEALKIISKENEEIRRQMEEQELFFSMRMNSQNFRMEKDKINEDEEEIDMDDFDENDNDNYIQILNNNLSPASKAEINNYVKEFKNELAEVISEKFNEFAKKSADEIYTKVLEKYVDLRKEEIKMGNMKTKAQLKEEAEQEINNALREKAIENFLSKMASQFFKEIVFKFKERCELKLKEFIDNLLNNEQANEFFASCDEINGKKKLKFEEDINKYIKLLQQKEEESQKKAIQAKFGSSKMESESCGCSPSEQNCGDSQPNCESSQPNTSSNFNYEKNF